MKRRAAAMRDWIYNRPEKHIALVTHGGFLHYMTEDWTGYVKGKGMYIEFIGLSGALLTMFQALVM